jgi:cobalt-zinc-cadmium efflux system outer membrane protein
MASRWLAITLGTLVLGGCSYAVRENADALVCDLPNHPFDLDKLLPADQSTRSQDKSSQAGSMESPPPTIQRAVFQADQKEDKAKEEKDKLKEDKFLQRFRYPSELPGSDAPPLRIPGPDAPKEERKKAIDKLYPYLPPLGADPRPELGPEGRPLTLADLQVLAQTNSPLLRQPAADVQAAWGAVLQAGAYPNPNFGYQADNVNTGDTAGYQGLFIEQTFKTAGKLEVAQASAIMSWRNAQVAFRRAQSDLATQVRQNYFAVLVAQENVKISKALAQFTDEIFRLQVDQLEAGEAATYEPMQLRVQAMQTRAALVQARNRYTAAWMQLAATLGLPGMKPTQLAGRIDMPLPLYNYEKSLAYVLTKHTDVLTAQNTIQKARYDLRLAQITPVPDLLLHLAVEKDFTTPPFNVTSSMTLGGPLPVFDRNRGNIIQAQGALMRANEEPHRVRDALTSSLAGAFEAYDNARVLLDYYRNRIIPDQVQAYRSVFLRHNVEGPQGQVSFGDVVTAQQTLVSTITTYVTTLGQAWTAVVNFADLLQTNDLFQIGLEPLETQPVEPVPDLENLLPVPCSHPCTPLPDPKLKGGHGEWPPAAPEEKEPKKPRTKESRGSNSPTPATTASADKPTATTHPRHPRSRPLSPETPNPGEGNFILEPPPVISAK